MLGELVDELLDQRPARRAHDVAQPCREVLNLESDLLTPGRLAELRAGRLMADRFGAARQPLGFVAGLERFELGGGIDLAGLRFGLGSSTGSGGFLLTLAGLLGQPTAIGIELRLLPVVPFG